MNVMPGWDIGSVGYHIDDGIIYPDDNQKGTKGIEGATRLSIFNNLKGSQFLALLPAWGEFVSQILE